MTSPHAAPPPERLEGDEYTGSITLTAKIASGRRSTVFLGHRDGDASPIVVRRPTSNPARFAADCEEAGGLYVGGPARPLAEDGALTMPAVVGESLGTILAALAVTGEPMPIHLALTVAMGIADELMKLDAASPHGDLVPHHVLIGYDGRVTVIDPAASAYRDRAEAPGREGYRSPEHVNGDALTPASDVFVLGILLFEMTTGQALYGEATHAANDARIAEGNMPRPRDIVGDGFPIELQLVLRKLLRPSASGRFANARAAKDALRLAATSRSDVGPEALAAWMLARFPERRAAWDDVLEASRARTVPLPAARDEDEDAAEAPSRAPTAVSSPPPRPYSLSGIAAESTVPTRALPRGQTDPLEPPEPSGSSESPLEVDTFQDLGGAKAGTLTMEQIERADAEERSLFTFPTASGDEDPDERGEPTSPLRAVKKRGAGRAAIPGLIPDLPTEVSSRRAQQVGALQGTDDLDASSEPTALDEIVESDLLSGSLEAIRLEPLPSLALDDDDSAEGRAWQAPFELEEEDPAERTMPPDAPFDLGDEPPPSTGPSPAPAAFDFDDEPPPSTGPSPAPAYAFDDEPPPSTGPSPAPLSAVDFLDDDAELSTPDPSDDDAFAPLDADFLDALGDDAPMPLASADFLDALPPNTDRHPATERFDSALDEDGPDTFPPDADLSAETPGAAKAGLPAATPARSGLPAAKPASGLPAPSASASAARTSGLGAPSGPEAKPASGLPALSSTASKPTSGLPAATPRASGSGLPAAKPASAASSKAARGDGAVPHGFTDASPTGHALEEELSSDLVLDDAQDSPDLTSDLWDADPNEPNDTIDESAAADILTPDELALMQRAAEIVPNRREDTAPFGLPPPAAPFRAATDPGPDTRLAGPTAPLRGATDPSGPPAALPDPKATSERPTAIGGSASLPEHKPRTKPADHSVRPLAPLMPPDKNDKPNQRGIATQVVRDRITDQHGAAIPSAEFANEGQVPTQVVRERGTSRPATAGAIDRRPPVRRQQTPPGGGPTFIDSISQEDSHNSELVIPLSDAEIRSSERRRRVLVGALVVAPVTVLAIGFLAYTQLVETPATVSIPSQGATVDAAPTRPPPNAAKVPPAPPPDDTISGIDATEEAAPPPPVKASPKRVAPPPARVEAPPPPVAPPPPIEPPPARVDPPPPVEPPAKVEPPATERVEAPPDEAPPPVEPPPPAPVPTKVIVRILPEHAKFEYDGVEYDNGAVLESGEDPIEILVYADGYLSQRQTVSPFQKTNLTVLLRPEPRDDPEITPEPEPDAEPEPEDPELDEGETIEP